MANKPITAGDRDAPDPTRTAIDPTIVSTIWSRLPRETDRAWAFFQIYRDMAYPQGLSGPFEPRSNRKVAEIAGVSYGTISQLSSSYQWHQRVGAYDRYVDQERQATLLSESEKLAKTHARRLKKLGALTEIELDKLLAKATLDADIGVIPPKVLLFMMEFVLKSERLLIGESGEIVESKGPDLHNVSVDDLRTLKSIYDKAKG